MNGLNPEVMMAAMYNIGSISHMMDSIEESSADLIYIDV
jgi:hypothetical protein